MGAPKRGLTALLSRLELNNFRAFKSEAFDFSRLNIFVGPNNSGKSSALSAINLLAQSLTTDSFGGGPVILNGPFDQLGTYKDMVHGGRANTPIRLSLNVEDFSYEFELKYRAQRREVELSRLKLMSAGRPVYEYTSSKDRYTIMIGGKDIDSLGIGIKKSRPRLIGFIPLFQEAFKYHQLSRMSSGSNFSQEIFNFLRVQERHISNFRRILLDSFRNYDTLGAFREMPQRTYLQSGETASKIGRFGQNTVTMLASDASKRGSEQIGLVDEISKWLQATGIASGIKVKYLTERHFELVVVGRDGSDHNICDVGFGCSQVLPVLVAGIELSNRARRASATISPTLLIQEPEIHLHPNAQAALGSFFASLSKLKCQVFIETHSDNLVLRIATHVASGDISEDSVRIFYVQDDDGLKRVTPIKVASDGSFIPPWPGGFFPQRQAESFELAKAASRKDRRQSEPTFNFIYPVRR
ncbi:AAA family ATPase [Mesorhizobium sp. YC-39]|uniref:AAA family ATPase n=1 Tax=unclassified Mesorhizobium TaxID=325217 RepID=UPI0021E8E337|nr:MULTISPECIES: AAA family ATPase [unclassified Mesorhizobium]MCV3210142.1 AAA family ATPase [Mesorhizobium sp. YC-2]MCV3230672.1 AAA family ATPase [Mesorhizobium sp. YC-39]